MLPRLVVLAVLALFSVVPALFQSVQAQATQAPRSSFTAAQRAEIVEILRTALRTDPSILRDAVAVLQNADGEREANDAREAIARLGTVLTHTPGDPVAGNPDGDVTLVEFYDMRCPYCRRMLQPMAALLAQDRKLRVVYKDIPILGPASVIGARAALAAGRQGAYLKMRDAMMTGPADITQDVVRAASARLGLDWDRMQRDMADPAIQARLDENIQLAHRLGIQGTPAYIVGDQMLPGAVTVAELQTAIGSIRKP